MIGDGRLSVREGSRLQKAAGQREIHLCGWAYCAQRAAICRARSVGTYADAVGEQSCGSMLLRFTRIYVQETVGGYVFGRMNYDADYVKQTMFYLEDLINEREMDDIEAELQYKRPLSETFIEAFDMLMKRNGDTRETMAEKVNMPSPVPVCVVGGSGPPDQCGFCRDGSVAVASSGLDQCAPAGQGVHPFQRDQPPAPGFAVHPQGAVERGRG